MRFPLLVCGTPKNIDSLPIVRLPSGKWKIVFENHQNTITHPLMGAIIDCNAPQYIMLELIERGNETNLNIYAEKIE